MYSIELTKKSKDFLKKLDEKERTVVLQKIYALRENPISHLKKLKGTKLWRLRIGKFRAICDVIIKGKRIIILRIGKRNNIY